MIDCEIFKKNVINRQISVVDLGIDKLSTRWFPRDLADEKC